MKKAKDYTYRNLFSCPHCGTMFFLSTRGPINLIGDKRDSFKKTKTEKGKEIK